MAQKRISTGTNGIPEVDCGQILRQFSSVIKLRTDQFAMCKAKHPSVLAVLRMRKKNNNSKQFRHKTKLSAMLLGQPQKIAPT